MLSLRGHGFVEVYDFMVMTVGFNKKNKDEFKSEKSKWKEARLDILNTLNLSWVNKDATLMVKAYLMIENTKAYQDKIRAGNVEEVSFTNV